jgi:NAD+--asparagine ADP-ribosyltransferase
MRKFLLLIFLSVGVSQITFTDEEVKTLENQFLQLEVQVDSLSTQDSLKTIEIDLLEQKISLLEEDVALTEKKAKLVKPSWYENKWLYFGYGAVLSYAVTTLINQVGNIIS